MSGTSGARRGTGLLLWAGCLCVVLWARFESLWILFAGAGAVACAAAWGTGRRHLASVVALAAALLAGFFVHSGDYRFREGWDSHWEERAARVAEAVRGEFADVVLRGGGAASRMADAAAAQRLQGALRDSVVAVLRQSGATAVAVFDETGRLRAWEGRHRGRLPAGELNGDASVVFGGTPLFSYLYFVEAVPGGLGAAVAAWLVRAELPRSLSRGREDFFSRMEEKTGERLRVIRDRGSPFPGEFALEWPGGSLRTAVEEPDAMVRRAERRNGWVAAALALVGLVWLLQSAGVPRKQLALSVGLLLAVATLAPLEVMTGMPQLADSAFFALPGPAPVTLGRFLLLAAAATPLVVLAAPARSPPAVSWGALILVAAGFPIGISWFAAAGSPELLGGGRTGWIAYELGLTLLLALAAAFAFALRERSRPPDSVGDGASRAGAVRESESVSWGLIAAGIAGAALLAFLVAMGGREGSLAPAGLAAAWVAPALLMVRGLARGRSGLSYAGWFCAAWLAATAVLSFAWVQRTEARKEIADQQLQRLGVWSETDGDSLLAGFADRALGLEGAGVSDVDLLYGAWTSRDFEEEGVPVFLTLWSAGDIPLRDLRLGAQGARPAVLERMLPTLRANGTREYYDFNEIGVRHLAAVALADGRLLTAAVPPRRTVAAQPVGGPLLSPALTGGRTEFLTLARAPTATPNDLGRRASWSRNEEGWMAEAFALYPDGVHSVSYTLSIANVWVMIARATLLLGLNCAVLSGLWLVGAGLLGVRFSVPVAWRGFFKSFRARVTWTLFGFFVLSAAIFGMLDYRTLADASERTAAALAERTVSDAAQRYRERGGSLELLGWQTGADLLEYRDGGLAGGSAPDLVDLGLYEGWVDPDIYAAVQEGRRPRASKVDELGQWRYVVAYERLSDGGIVASPVSLRAGAAALRMRDVVHLLGFAVVMGPILSLALALFVGRALTRPMQTLQVASERVGRGNLAVHLPEDRVDEFGSVFAAFNRMVLRLGAARRELLRTTRRTEAIVDAAATGVIAMDMQGRVTVANPRAESLLSVRLVVGETVPADSGHGAELAQWLAGYRASRTDGSSKDFKWGSRRIRGRARRIVHEGHAGGVVINLEDVTDELRGERILAWGEMAQQVAHEVKNPLTPMKLSVQQVLRAWSDKRRDFARILEENASAVLREIDRLASIARSFSRLGTPGPAAAEPVEPVDAAAVVSEVLDLYRGGEDHIRVVADLSPALPRALVRPDELKEVLINLLENARGAMPDGGVIHVRASGSEFESTLNVFVEDEGTGIPAELLPRVFEPQFSTRSKGAGLGLAIVQRLVDSWGGSVELTSEPGRGTTVTIALRAVSADESPATEETPAAEA